MFLIEAERARSRASVDFPAPGPGRHDDHLAGMQPVRQFVQIGEPGRHPRQAGAAGLDGLHLVQGRLHQLRQRLVVLAGPPVGDPVHLRLGPVDDVGRRPPRRRRSSARSGSRRRPAGAGSPSRGRSRRRSRRWPPPARSAADRAGTAPPPTRISSPRLPSSADTVTASAGSPRPYRSMTAVVDLLVGRPVEVAARAAPRRRRRSRPWTSSWRRARTARPPCPAAGSGRSARPIPEGASSR